ncbi:MAG: YcnI family protein [Microbacterium sp.]|uniref:YcnI family copper-binding membrane protein n=1 Tax=Microbacterium sp. TaxID=51671 RepID=UPI0039E62C69
MPRKRFIRPLTGLAAGLAIAVAVPLSASAHVTVSPDQATAGGYAYVTLRVPNEMDAAVTTRIDLQLPTDTPFTFASYEPTPGWTVTVTTSTLPAPVDVSGNTVTEAPTSISFVADAGGIEPGQFQTFMLVLGPVPDVGHVVLPAVQTYDDGTVVDWTATPEQLADDDTLDPAPVLWVNDTPPETGTATSAPEASATDASGSSDGVSLGLSVAALVVAVGGALLGAFAVGRTRRARS